MDLVDDVRYLNVRGVVAAPPHRLLCMACIILDICWYLNTTINECLEAAVGDPATIGPVEGREGLCAAPPVALGL